MSTELGARLTASKSFVATLDVGIMSCRLRDMDTKRQASVPLAVYTIRADRQVLDRMAEIAAAEHRTLVQKLRVMMEREIAEHAKQQAA